MSSAIEDLESITQPHPELAPKGKQASAVLVAVISTPEDDAKIILTKRASTLRHHAGQISFPGGKVGMGETIIEAALRESQEEIDLNPASVKIKGFLSGVETIANFHISPVLGILDQMPNLTPAPDEVERILIEPLAPLLSSSHHGRQERIHEGRRYKTWVIDHPNEYIWGATAKMLVQWSRAITAESRGVA